MSKTLGKTRAGPSSRIPRPGAFAASRIPSVATAQRPSENKDKNVVTKNKKKRQRLNSCDLSAQVPPSLRDRKKMPPPVPVSNDNPQETKLVHRMVSGSSEFVRRKIRPRNSVISSHHEKAFCSPDVSDKMQEIEFKSSTPTSADGGENEFDFSKPNNCTFEISKSDSGNERVLNRDGTFSLDDPPNHNVPDGTFSLARKILSSTIIEPDAPAAKCNESYVINKCNATFDADLKTDLVLSDKISSETFSKDNDVEMEHSESCDISEASDKPKRPSSWTDCGPRTFILGAASNFGKTFQDSPVGPYGSSKQSSIDQDESLGILTPDQMDSLLVLTPPNQPLNPDLRVFLLQQQQTQRQESDKSPGQTYNMSRMSPPTVEGDDCESLMIQENSNQEELLANISQPLWMNNSQLPITPTTELSIQQYLQQSVQDQTLIGMDSHQNSTLKATSQNCVGLLSPNVSERDDPNIMQVSAHLFDDGGMMSISGGSTSTVDMVNSQDGEDQLMRRQALNLLLQKAHQSQEQQMMNRNDMTPSPPEELPLDPVDIKLEVESEEPERHIGTQENSQEQMSLADSESKSQSTSGVSKTSNSFVASVTSITSLDNGYQGDGEMSRPVSRGAESHHLHSNGHNVNNNVSGKNNVQTGDSTVVVVGRHHARPDPMTDSDFFTESDADLASSEDTAHRLARVIDGRLVYGHTAANNNAGIPTAGPLCLVEDSSSSCMESSGVYTDLENNSRTVTPPQGIMVKSASSSDSSAISPNASAYKVPLDETMAMSVDESSEPIAVKSPSSSTKKSKPSSKTNTSSGGASGKENKRPQIKRCNKWDSVMNKIAENKNARPTIHLREVKSKISTGLTNNNNGSSPTSRVRALNKVACSSVQSLNERSLNSQQLKAKSRRTRVRASESNLLQDDSQSDVSSNAAGNTVNSSPLSATPARSTPTSGVTHSLHQRQNTSSPRKPPAAAVQANNRAAKKRDVVRQTSTPPALSEHPVRHTKQAASPMRPVRPNNLLQKRGLSPASNSNAAGNVGNGGGGPPAEPKVPRKIISSKRPVSSAKSAPLKEHNRLPLSQTAVAAQANNNNNLKSSVQAAATAPCTPPSPAPQPPVTTIPEMCGTVATFPAKCEKMVAVAEKATAITAREIAILHKSNRGLEALGVLVQYLVYDLDAFACPSLKRAQRSTGISLMEARTNCARLEQQLADQILRHARDVSEKDRLLLVAGERAEERSRTLEGIITELTRERDNAYEQIMQMKKSHAEQFESIQAEFNLEKSETAGEIAFLRQTIEERCSEVRENRKKLDEQVALLEDERNRCEEDRCMYEKELMKLQQSLSESENAAKSAERDAEKWRIESKTIRVELENKLELLQHELIALRNKNAENEFNGPRTETNILKDEVESLRNVLELKQSELSELRKRNLELNRAAEQLPATQAKVQMLEARVEDLQVQLQRKMEDEKELHQRNKLLEESFHQEAKQKTRLSQYNEELQYRLKQNHEVVNVLAAMTGTTPEAALSPRKVLDYNGLSNNNSFYNDSGSTPNFVRSHSRNGSNGGRMSFNERYGSSERSSIKLERKHSFREKPDKYRTSSITVDRQLSNGSSPSHTNPRAYDRHNSSPAHDSSGQSSDTSFEGKPHNKSQDCCFEMEDLSPPASPQIKAVVEKSDSVSWVLEIAEPPEIVASRLVRRAGSFRNSTPPPKKNTSSPSHQSQQQSPPLLKRPRCNTGLTQRVVLNNEIARQNSDPTSARSRSNSITKLTRSASMGCAALNDSIVADWSNCGGSSTPYKSKQDSPSFRQNGEKESQILITCDTTVLTSRCDELCPTLPAHRSIISNQRADSPDSSVSDDSENSVDDCDKKSDENRMDGSWSEDGDTDI